MSADEPITELAAAVAELGALPMPVGPGPQARSILDRARDALGARMTKDDLCLVLENVINYAAGLEAERHSTNEALDDAVQALRANRASEPTSGGYPPALPWVALMDDEDLQEFLGDLLDSLNSNPPSTRAVLAEVEKTCGQWRLIAEAQHGHTTAPGPDAVTSVFVPVASLREVPDGEHAAWVRHSYRTPHDLPGTGGA